MGSILQGIGGMYMGFLNRILSDKCDFKKFKSFRPAKELEEKPC